MSSIKVTLIGLLISVTFFTNHSIIYGETLSPEVSQSLKTISKWVNQFESMSENDVLKILGKPKTEAVWEFDGSNYPIWKYQWQGSRQELILYFFRSKVLKTSFQVLSD